MGVSRHVITLTAMQRPASLREMLASLLANDLEGWRVLVGVEPSERSGEILAIANEMLAGVDHEVWVNDRVLGVRENPYRVIERAFGDGAELVLHLEEDFLLSPDVTRLALWFEENHEPDWFCATMLAGVVGGPGPLSNRDYPELLFKSRTFNPLGVVMRRQEWERYIHVHWLDHGKRPRHGAAAWLNSWGWDWAVYASLALQSKMYSIQPVLARVNHQGGELGVHVSAEHQRVTFERMPINEAKDVDYRLVPIEELPQEVASHALTLDQITEVRLIAASKDKGYLKDVVRAVGKKVPFLDKRFA